ncbi:DMT family transporter [Kocuria sp.]|uniref:DMT family transporter n=1 Tax=Kocuria sp. TaxID=1871328 RepID=UPI00289C395D|nr:DMT family transporter [Kocuria sp.]
MQWVAVSLALMAALCLALGTQTQSAAVTAHTQEALKPSNLGSLARNPKWVAGLVLLGLGTALNVGALTLATVTVVQPIGVIALVITTLLHAKHKHLDINARTWGAISLCTAGGAVFVVAAVAGTDPSYLADPRAEIILVSILIALVLFFGVAELFLRHRRISMFYVLAAGILYGFVAVLVRLTMTHTLAHGLGQIHWFTVIMIVLASVVGGWMVQCAYSCGPPDLVIAGLTVVDPIVGVILGLSVLGEAGPGFTPGIGAIMCLAGGVAIVGVVLLSRHHPEVIERREQAKRLEHELSSKSSPNATEHRKTLNSTREH